MHTVNQSEEQSKLKHCRLEAHLPPVRCHIKHNLHHSISGQVPGNRATEVTLPTVAGYHVKPHGHGTVWIVT